MTAILGLSAYYHDSAAALLIDGKVIAAAQEERFSRRKNDAEFPRQAIEYCLSAGGIGLSDLDLVGYYEKPLLKFERLLESQLATVPLSFPVFRRSMPIWLHKKLFLRRELRKQLGKSYRRRFVFGEHHEAHAASAFFPSPFDEAAILTVDGVGEWTTVSMGQGQGNKISLSHEIRFPHSIGLLYSAFTAYCGFAVNSGEYKLMGLAPYGTPRYVEAIKDNLLELHEDGSFHLNSKYFGFIRGNRMTTPAFDRLFGGAARKPDTPVTQKEMDLASSIQCVTEEAMAKLVRRVHEVTGQSNLCMAGGVALNCVANGRILRESPFDDVWVQPAAGDAGGALGVCQWIGHQLLDLPRAPIFDRQQGSFLGPAYEDAEIEQALRLQDLEYEHFPTEQELADKVSGELARGSVVAWHQGRMEFGPRALGHRSFLADARSSTMRERLNEAIKQRESFRPFAPSILEERVADYFSWPSDRPSPFMSFTTQVKSVDDAPTDRSRRRDSSTSVEKIPAVTHVDHSSRLHTVDQVRNPAFYRLLQAFEKLTGCPMLVNTSLNVRGEPMACAPEDSIRCFLNSPIDVLAIGRFVVTRSSQPKLVSSEYVKVDEASISPVTALTGSPEVGLLLLPEPTQKQAIWFCRFWLPLAVTLGSLGLGRMLSHIGLLNPFWLVAIPLGMASGVAIASMIVPHHSSNMMRFINRCLYPISWIVSQAVLCLIFFGVVTPIGLTLKLLRHDSLELREQRDQSTNWKERKKDEDIRRPFRTY